ncbi:prolyl oligopeptidase family serine peptidase [Tunturibacter psychrotolerans]|uniref:Prolyl oligopeptidase family serine peptidase n=1 Tax=Tunturiibacter psychrotolerans TaxID=3069686 RepID=A0AAU7ZQQ6_9BACT
MRNRVIRVTLLAATIAGALGWGWGQVGGPSATPAAKHPMTFDDLQRMKRISDPQISPSGKWVMFSDTEVDLDRNSMANHLWVVPLGGAANVASGARERQITSTKDGEFGGRFSPDGKMLLFIANEGEMGRSQIFVAPWDDTAGKPGTPKRLTNIIAGAAGARWAPDSQRILFTSPVYPECSDEAAWAAEDACNKAKDEAAGVHPVETQASDHDAGRDQNSAPGSKRSHMLVVFATNGNAMRDLTPHRNVGDAEVSAFSWGSPIGYGWAPDSMEVVFVANPDNSSETSTNNNVFVLRLNDAAARPVKLSTSPGSDDSPAYSPDGKWLAFRSRAHAGQKNDQFKLKLLDRRSGAISDILPNFDRSIDEFIWAPDSASVFFATHDRGESQIYSVAVADEDTIHYVPMPTGYLTLLLSQTKSESDGLQISSDGSWLVSTSTKVERPAEIFRTSLRIFTDDAPEVKQQKIGLKLALAEDKANPPIDRAVPVAPEALTHLNDRLLESLALEKMQPFWFAAQDNTKMQGFLIPPPAFDPSRKYPVKLLIHEDPHKAWGDKWSYRWNPELMAAPGYVIVMVNPRGSTGYGQAFLDGLNGEWGGKVYSDLLKGLDYAEQHYSFIDKARECTLGTGFGGFMANWILTHTNRFACVVTHDGMVNLENIYGATGSTDVKSVQWSPIPSIQNARTPTLVIHSQRGNRLDVSESQQLYTALQRLNVQSRMLNLPNDGHLEDQPQNAKLWYESVGDWCDRWTKTNRYATGSTQPARLATAPEPTKPQPVPASSRPGASTAPETTKTQPPPAEPAITTSASSVPPVQQSPAPLSRTLTQPTIAPPAPVLQPSPRPAQTTETSAAPARGLPVVSTTKPISEAANTTISQTVPTVPPSTAPLNVPLPQPRAVPPPLSPQSISQGSFAISISALENKLQIGEDARVMITLTNVSDHPILFDHRPGTDNPEFSFIFLVRNASGRLMGENIANSPSASDFRTVDHVPPGGTVVQTAHLSKLVHLGQPGLYTVRVYRKDADKNLVVQSNEITLNVVSSLLVH